MTFTLTVETDNASFTVDPRGAVAECLRQVARRLDGGATGGLVRDLNGNTIGAFMLQGDRT